LVPDNLRTGVDKPDLYDPKINRSYLELAEHYQTLVDPARARKPRDKARVERPMPYIRDSYWRGRTFQSLSEMRTAARTWCLRVAGQRNCKPLEGASPLTIFETVEAPTPLPLPARPFVLARWSTPKVGPDIHVKVGKTIYSVPWKLIGQHLDARETDNTVQFFHQGQLVATHGRKPKGKQTDLSHYPPEKVTFPMRTPVWCQARAKEIGPACVEVIDAILGLNALYRLRSAQGVLGLVDKHTPPRVEAACRMALDVGDPSYRTIKGILVAHTEAEPVPAAAGDAGAGAHPHGPERLFSAAFPTVTVGQPPTVEPVTTGDPVRVA
jgi:hypothetical protein